MYKKFLKEWYILNKSQQAGTLVLILILSIILLLKAFYNPDVNNDTLYFASIESENTPKQINHHQHLFFFNPNTASESELKTLGLNNKIVQNIIHYRQKGGKFVIPSDLRKIYSMNDSIYKIIEPYILIDTHKRKPFISITSQKNHYAEKDNHEDIKPLNLNTADSIALLNLKGIGPVLSSRIIKYRTRLGGFYAIEQLKEVYGIKDSIYKFIINKNYIFIDTNEIKKINVHQADFKTMIRHPYFNKEIVVKILEMQKKQEKISEERLKAFIPENDWKKLKYYINY